MRTASGTERRVPGATNELDALSLIILYHDALLLNLREARRLHLNHGVGAAWKENQKARDLVSELTEGLDYERGGRISRDLGLIYDFAAHRLMDLDRSSDGSMYDRLIRLFSGLRGAWEHVRIQN